MNSFITTDFFKSITDISATSPDNLFIESSFEMFSLDDISSHLNDRIPAIKERCDNCQRRVCKLGFEHCSVDALYIHPNEESFKLVFIEFKKKNIFNTSELTPYIERNLKELINKLDFLKRVPLSYELQCIFQDHQTMENHIKFLKKAIKEAQDSHKHLLKLKSLESVVCILQWMYVIYCYNNAITPNIEDFRSFLSSCEKEYLIVHCERPVNINHTRHLQLGLSFPCKSNPFEIQRLTPYPFDKIEVKTPIQFTSFLNEIQ